MNKSDWLQGKKQAFCDGFEQPCGKKLSVKEYENSLEKVSNVIYCQGCISAWCDYEIAMIDVQVARAKRKTAVKGWMHE